MKRFFSFGGGRQSVASMVMAAKGVPEFQFDAFIFSNVGHDSEHPATLKYFYDVALPFAKKNGIELIEIKKKIRGKVVTLREYTMGDNKSVSIPARLSNGAPGNRSCTVDFKVRNVARFIRNKYKIYEWEIGLGISTNEIQRANNSISKVGKIRQHKVYPLIDVGMSLNDCVAVIADAGLPIPEKSACYFCPFHRPVYWVELKQTHPDLFEDAANIEDRINEKRNATGRDIVRLHPSMIPLRDAVGDQYNFFDELENCESGYCMT